jgi:translocation and assembly module TamA
MPRIIVLLAMLLCSANAVHAADPQPYKVDLTATGDGTLDGTLRATSELVALQKSAPVSPFGLIARARGDIDRLKTVLESYGYYQASIMVTIEGQPLTSPTLGDALTALAKDKDAHVALTFNLGPLYHLGNVTIDGALPGSVAGALSLKPGAPAVAAYVLGAGARLLTALQEDGYAFAKVDAPVAYEDQTLPMLDVSFHVTTGERVNIGEIKIQGLGRVHEKFVRRRLIIHTGQPYKLSAIEAARRDLLSLGPFGTINVQMGTAVDATGGVPVTFVVTERKRHAVSLTAAFSSDLGGSGGVSWSDRNVFGNAEQLNITAAIINLGGSDTNGVGYDVTGKYIIPDFGHRDQSLQFSVEAIKQFLQAYDQKAIKSGLTLTRKLSSVWSASVGIATANEQIEQPPYEAPDMTSNGVGDVFPAGPNVLATTHYNYTLVALPFALNLDTTHLASPLDDPTHGMRDSLNITPTESLGRPSASFIISQIKIAAYFDLHDLLSFLDTGRSVLAVRALAGEAQGAGQLSLPPDQRFYAGGSGTIRGYEYQIVGPHFYSNDDGHYYTSNAPGRADTGIPIGGTAIAVGSLEFRQRIGANWGAAVFVDGGQVSASLKPVPSDFRVGVGAGVRYYTPIGPVRVDLAVPTTRESGDQGFQIYIGLGQSF